MTIQDLGSIGELVAAIATVATLAYLAVQIRQNTDALRSTALQTHNQNIQQTIALIASSPENASVWQRGLDDFDSLSPKEQAQLNALLMGTFKIADAAYLNYQNGLLTKEIWDLERGVLTFYLRSSGGRRAWETCRRIESLSSGFIEFGDSLIRNSDS